MTRPIRGGATKPVKVVADADLHENGGRYVIPGRLALPVKGSTVGEEDIIGGVATPVYIVTQTMLDDGDYRLAGGSARPLINNDDLAKPRTAIGNHAIPVFVVSGSLTTPAPVPPAGADALLLETGDYLLLETGDKILLE